MIYGIDISEWQGIIDWAKVKKSKSFAIIKATEGGSYVDKRFARNRDEARRAGIARGFYHFANPDFNAVDPEREAEFFISTIGKLQNGEVLALDLEREFGGDEVNWSLRFLKRVEKLTKVKPLIYINMNYNNKYNWKPVVDNNNGLWIAYWDNKPSASPPKTDWKFVAMKQYGASTKVDGIAGNVDGDVFYGTVEQFKKYGYNGGGTVPPTPPPVDPCKNIKDKLEKCNATVASKVAELNKCKKEVSTTLNSKLQGANAKIESLTNQLKKEEAAHKACVEQYDMLEVKHHQLDEKYQDAMNKLGDCKVKQKELLDRAMKCEDRLKKCTEGCTSVVDWLADVIKKLISYIPIK